MHDPLTVTIGTAAGATFAYLFPDATPAVVMCSLAGTALYVLSSRPHRFWRQVLFAFVSFVGGIHSAGTASEIIAAVINAGLGKIAPGASVQVTPGVGALVASTVCVSVLLRVMAKYQGSIQTKEEGE